METKIESVFITGGQAYHIKNKYNDLLLDRIEDISLEYPDSFISFFRGFTVEGNIVFEVIGAPVSVEYVKTS